MRILAAIPARADSSYAHAINTFKMADGFARVGHDVVLACLMPKDATMDLGELREKLSLHDGVSLAPVATGPLKSLGKYIFVSKVVGLARRFKPEMAYLRDVRLPVRLARDGVPVAAETHGGPPLSRSQKALFAVAAENAAIRSIITISPVLRAAYIQHRAPESKVIVIPSGVDLGLFHRPEYWQRPLRSRAQAVYSGHLYDYKGIPTVLEAAGLLPDFDFVLVGGWPEDVERVRARIAAHGLANVTLTGNVAYAALPSYLWNADVLVLPPSANHPSAQWTSPVKLGEYLASGTPVVASNIPALRGLVTGDDVCFFRADDAGALAAALRRVVNEPGYAAALAVSGARRAGQYGYAQRARSIVDHTMGGEPAAP